MATRKYYTEGSGARQVRYDTPGNHRRREAEGRQRASGNGDLRSRTAQTGTHARGGRAGYVPGSAAPDISKRPKSLETPLSREERLAWVKKQSERRAQSRAQANYTMGMVCAVIVAVMMCCYLLWNTASMRAEKSEVTQLQSKLEKQLEENANYSSGLESMVDLDEIYEFATTELGMVYSQPGQTLYYTQNNDDYVVQFKNVPETN